MTDYRLYFDGLCDRASIRGARNPGGLSTYGWLLYDGDKVIAQDYGIVHKGGTESTNNVAEYTALIRGLEYVSQEMSDVSLSVYGDSRLVINQVTAIYGVYAPLLKPLYSQAATLIDQIRHCHFQWIPREQNEAADQLSRKAYQETLEETRLKRAKKIEIKPMFMSETRYRADGRYTVDLEARKCECQDFTGFCKYVGIRCKHLIAADMAMESEDEE